MLHREQETLKIVTDKISTYETMFEQLKKMTGAVRLEEVRYATVQDCVVLYATLKVRAVLCVILLCGAM
jgi:hypothetical protein